MYLCGTISKYSTTALWLLIPFARTALHGYSTKRTRLLYALAVRASLDGPIIGCGVAANLFQRTISGGLVCDMAVTPTFFRRQESHARETFDRFRRELSPPVT